MPTRTCRLVVYVTGRQQAAYRQAADEREMAMAEWVRQELSLALERHAGFKRRKKKEEALSTWPSGWPKNKPCPDPSCLDVGSIHPTDPAAGHGWDSEKLQAYLQGGVK